MHIHTLFFGLVLAVAGLAFVIYFFIPALQLNKRLGGYVRDLETTSTKDLNQLKALFKNDITLSHTWKEFQDTLHRQEDLTANDGVIITIRQTVPAETYFSEQMLVNSPLRTEFFKHLPGILTGIGIIGTFTGLISGLHTFQVSDSPEVVRNSLTTLLHGVSQAFLISGSAIAMAMVITGIEKWMISNLYKKVEKLCLAIDSRFEAGAGEEYLLRLVQASESSATEAKHLKQSFVNELRQILETISERQIEAQNASTTGIAEKIVAGVENSLKEPLNNIGLAVQHVSGSQSSAVNSLLTDTMAAFTAKIQDLFAGQVDGIRGLQQKTIDTLGTAVGKLEQFIGDISSKGQETTDAMGAQLASTLASMDERQRAMNVQAQALVDTMRSQMVKSQEDVTSSMQQAIDKMGSAVGEISKRLQTNIDSASERDEKRGRELIEHTTTATTSAAALTKELVSHTAEAIASMRSAVDSMRSGTSDTVSKMNLGAADMLRAANEMTKVGSTTGSALDKAQSLVDQLLRASGALSSSNALLNSAIEDYKTTRDTLATMVEQLKVTVEGARREASLTADVLQRIESATQNLKEAEVQAERYLAEVSEVLKNAHREFGEQVLNTLSTVNGAFHEHVAQGTRALGGAIDGLEQTLDRLGNR